MKDFNSGCLYQGLHDTSVTRSVPENAMENERLAGEVARVLKSKTNRNCRVPKERGS
jgi:hypothetical protein